MADWYGGAIHGAELPPKWYLVDSKIHATITLHNNGIHEARVGPKGGMFGKLPEAMQWCEEESLVQILEA